MIRVDRLRSIPAVVTLLLASMLAVPAVGMAAQAPVDLRTVSSFGVLAGQGITNTGPTTIGGNAGGDVGTSPNPSFTGAADVTMSGAQHLADAVALQAQADLGLAYDDAAGRIPFATIGSELGGTTLKPGVYVSETGAFGITGTLTLDAEGDPNAVFIFKTASDLVTASDSDVVLINGARPCLVYWQVTSSATLGTDSNFVGHLFALQSIAAQTGATITGQLLARNGTVTLDNNVITNVSCPPVPATTPTPTVTGGVLPNTASPWYNVLFAGVALAVVGAAVWKTRKTHA